MSRNKVFISYSHDDRKWLESVKSQLAVLQMEGQIDLFEDTQIKGGEDWFARLDKEMNEARIAVLLVSHMFLTSEFIRTTEVPRLFAKHRKDGMVIYPLLVRDCAWQDVRWLASLQIRPGEGKPLKSMRPAAREKCLADIARQIAGIARQSNMPKHRSPRSATGAARSGMQNAILSIDGYQWAFLKNSTKAMRRSEEKRFDKALNDYHKLSRDIVEMYGGEVRTAEGDRLSASFTKTENSVDAAISIQNKLASINEAENRLGFLFAARIGIALVTLEGSMSADHSVGTSTEYEAKKLMEECPPGSIQISRAAFASLRRNQRPLFRPALTSSRTDDTVVQEGSLVWRDRSPLPKDRDILNFPEPQIRAYPPIYLTSEYYDRVPYLKGFENVTDVIADSVVVLGETKNRQEKGNRKEWPVHHPTTTSTAVGIIEVLASCNSSSVVEAAIDEWVDTVDLACRRNLIIIGSPIVNLYAHAVNSVLPIGFTDDPLQPLRIRIGREAPKGRKSPKFFPSGVDHSKPDTLYGLVLLTHSPLNPERSLLWIAGITGMGTQAAARLVRDLILHADKARKDLSRSTKGLQSQALSNVAIVRPKFNPDFSLQEYGEGGWRVTDYHIEWSEHWSAES